MNDVRVCFICWMSGTMVCFVCGMPNVKVCFDCQRTKCVLCGVFYLLDDWYSGVFCLWDA